MEAFRPLGGVIITLGLVAVAVGIAVTVTVLLHEANRAPTAERAAARIEAIKTGLATGAGVGGMFALLLAARRQWLNERAQLFQEDDAAERRVTELYTKAAEQLGHAEVSVRLAALYALERLASDYRQQRQTIVNVLCACVRNAAGDELMEVSRTALEVLGDHLNERGPETRRDSWWGVNLSLYNASIDSMRFAGELGEFVFLYSKTRTDVLLGGTTFLGEAKFQEAHLGRYADFHRCVFRKHANFMSTTFHGFTEFSHCLFEDEAAFYAATFRAEATFEAAVFRAAADFYNMDNQGVVNMRDCVFHAPVRFDPHVKNIDLTGARFASRVAASGAVLPAAWTTAASDSTEEVRIRSAV